MATTSSSDRKPLPQKNLKKPALRAGFFLFLHPINADALLGAYNYSHVTVMAEEHPPSPTREDDILSRGSLRVKPAMMVRVESRFPQFRLKQQLNISTVNTST